VGATALWLDLDGTLIDTWRRHWRAYLNACAALKMAPGSFARFKTLKRRGPRAADALIAGLNLRQKDRFRSVQKAWIEHPSLLALDRPFPGTQEFLRWAGLRFEVHLATSRTSEAKALHQLDSLGLRGHFRRVVVTNGASGRPRDKATLARSQKGATLWVGDTEAEAFAARAAKAPFFACSRGIRERAILLGLGPAAVFSNYAALRRALAPLATPKTSGR